MKAGQNVNTLSDVQMPLQNCTTVQSSMLHAAHGWKEYHVSFPMKQIPHHLDFRVRSYGHNREDCSEDPETRGN